MRTTFASLVAAAGLAGLSSASCVPNVCLNDIIKAPHGIQSCCSFLLTTVVLPTPTVYFTPSAVDTVVYTTTISSTETDYASVDYQPSSVIVSTYTSTYVISSVTYTTTDEVTTTLTTDFTATETTALHTSTTTTTTTTTTAAPPRHPRVKRFGKVVAHAPLPAPSPRKTIVPSKVPDHASVCQTSYSKVCLSAGGTAATTTITPSTVTVTLASTSVSTDSIETTLYASSTITLTSTETLPSLHSTTTLVVSSTDYTSTATVTSYTSTETDVSDQISTATIASTTTTTTTTRSVATPTPFKLVVSYEQRTKSATENVQGDYLAYTNSQQTAQLPNFNGNAGITFVQSTSDQFALDADNKLLSLVGSVLYYLVVDSSFHVELVKTPAPDATYLTCTVGSSKTLSCNKILQVIKLSGSSHLDVLVVTTDSKAEGVLTLKTS